MRRRVILTIFQSAFLALFFCCSAAEFAQRPAAAAQAMQFSTEPLAIETAGGERLKFVVELALTDRQREHGLMFRKSMPANHGMLFDFGASRRVMMWMENTPLPLDMLFLDEKGTITAITENAVPFSQAIIDSQGPVKYVIELNGGAAKKFGLAIGDRVSSATISRAR